MPYTLAHPAAVLPLLGRGRLVTSGLLAGAMAPDLPFFAGAVVPRVFAWGVFTHSLPAVCTVDVLLAAALVLGWRALRAPLVRLLPARVAGRVDTLTRPGPRPHPGWFAVSAALGALTHVVWDGFTHPGRFGERLLPVLGRTVAGLPLYQVLQYASSAAALVVLARWCVRRVRGAEPVVLPPVPGRAAARALGVFSLLWGAGAAVRHGLQVGAPLYRTPMDFLPSALFYSGAAAACWAAGYAAVLRATAMISARGAATRMPIRDAEPQSPRDARLRSRGGAELPSRGEAGHPSRAAAELRARRAGGPPRPRDGGRDGASDRSAV